MNEKFFDLKKEKQDRMINAALKIFAQYGYKYASTDDIVKEASISKGLLFHYFGSKLGLYAFIYEYSSRFVMLEMRSGISESDREYFTIQKKMQFAQLQYSKVYPYMELFLLRAMEEDTSEALLAIEERRTELTNYFAHMMGQADLSALGDKAQAEMIVKMLRNTLQANLRNSVLEQRFQAEMLYDENVRYIELVEKLVK